MNHHFKSSTSLKAVCNRGAVLLRCTALGIQESGFSRASAPTGQLKGREAGFENLNHGQQLFDRIT